MSCRTSDLEFSRPKVKGKRRYGAKVKTGCRTCKIRHVKCDERKPACVRCTSTGRRCDGYTQEASLTSQPLSPSQSSSFLSGLGDSVVYLEFYHYCAGPTLASNFDHEFWSRTVLQMAQTEPAVRHAVIALSYLVKTEPGNLKHARSVSTDGSRRTLLFHYNKAVRSLVDRMAQSSHLIEVGLVTCLLFICIEFLRGDYHVAFTHLHSGLKVIAEWHQRPPDASQSDSSPQSPSTAVAKQEFGSKVVAGDLVPMFIRAMATGLLYDAPIEPLLWDICPRPQTFQPKAFTSLREAQSAIYNLRNATVVLIMGVTRSLYSGTEPTIEDLQYHAHLLNCHESWLRALHVLESEGKMSSRDLVVVSSIKISYYSTYIALAAAMDVHQTAFDAHIHGFKALNHHAQIMLDSMATSTGTPPAGSATPAGSPLSSASGSETSATLPNNLRQTSAHFTFEISLIPSLYFAATRCRCPTTRRTSVSFLATNPPREALWDAEQHALVARRVIEIEEREVDPQTGMPVPATRLANAIIHGDMDANGGFWVSFASAAWIVAGCGERRRKGDRVPLRPDAEWDEWFVL